MQVMALVLRSGFDMNHEKEPSFLSSYIYDKDYIQYNTISQTIKTHLLEIVLFHHMDHHRNPSEHLCNIFMIGLFSAGATLL